MQAQTRRPDRHLILFNGEQAAKYDTRVIEDLIDDSLLLKAYPYDDSIAHLSVQCLKLLLEQDIDVFFKIDSDDMYASNYVEVIAAYIENRSLDKSSEPFAINLINQLWLSVDNNNDVSIREHEFHRGLGLSKREIAQGVQVGAPPTYVMNRSAMELIVNNAENAKYQQIKSDDILFRQILIDNGIVVERLSTPKPVFGYVQHAKNSSDW
ncbi:MAG: hypothetical protein AAF431_02735 [Pseudomonadota bacterium]